MFLFIIHFSCRFVVEMLRTLRALPVFCVCDETIASAKKIPSKMVDFCLHIVLFEQMNCEWDDCAAIYLPLPAQSPVPQYTRLWADALVLI